MVAQVRSFGIFTCLVYFIRMSIGGALIGWAIGFVLCTWIKMNDRKYSHGDGLVQLALTLVAAYVHLPSPNQS